MNSSTANRAPSPKRRKTNAAATKPATQARETAIQTAPTSTTPAATFEVSNAPINVAYHSRNVVPVPVPAVQAALTPNGLQSGQPVVGVVPTNSAAPRIHYMSKYPYWPYQQPIVPPKTSFGTQANPASDKPGPSPNGVGPTQPLQQPSNVTISVTSLKEDGQKPKVIKDGKGAEKPKSSKHTAIRYSFAQRVQALTLLTHKYDPAYIEWCTEVKPKTQTRIFKSAQERGFDFMKSPLIHDAYVVDGVRTGRPKGSKTLKRKGVPVNAEENPPDFKRWSADKRVGAEHRESVDTPSDAEAVTETRAEVDNEEESDDDDDEYAEVDPPAPQIRPGDAAREMQGVAAQLAGIQQYLKQYGGRITT